MRKERLTIERIRALIDSAQPIARDHRGYALTYEQTDFVAGWMASAANCIELLTSPATAYRSALISARARFETSNMIGDGDKAEIVGNVRGILQSLLDDVEAGLITRLESRIVGEAFGDFLDQAERMASRGEIASGVLAGVVSEDTVRRIGRDNGIEHGKVDQVISMLVKAEVITDAKAKSARVGAHVRTKATHACILASASQEPTGLESENANRGGADCFSRRRICDGRCPNRPGTACRTKPHFLLRSGLH